MILRTNFSRTFKHGMFNFFWTFWARYLQCCDEYLRLISLVCEWLSRGITYKFLIPLLRCHLCFTWDDIWISCIISQGAFPSNIYNILTTTWICHLLLIKDFSRVTSVILQRLSASNTCKMVYMHKAHQKRAIFFSVSP